MDSQEKAANLLDDAADLLERTEWTQGAERESNGTSGYRYCSVGALRFAQVQLQGGTYGWPEYAQTALQTLMGVLPESFQPIKNYPFPERFNRAQMAENCVIGYNDHEGRTKQEVLDRFRDAAKELRK